MSQNKLSFARNAAYNTAGALILNLCLWLMTLLAVRLGTGYDDAGVWQLAISVTNVFTVIAAFNLHTYLITDVKDEYSSGEYLGTELFTDGCAVALCAVYLLLFGYRQEELWCVLFYMLFCATNAFAWVLHAIQQRGGRMDAIGISNAVRGIASLALFTAGMLLTHRLTVSALAMLAGNLLLVLLYDLPKARGFAPVRPRFPERKRLLLLLLNCCPIVFSLAVINAIGAFPRQRLELLFGNAALGYYGSVATPVVILQVLANNIFTPLLRELALLYQKKDIRAIQGILKKLALYLLLGTVAAFIGAALLGEFALVLLYGESIRPYAPLLYGVIGCSVLCIVCFICTNLLIVMRKGKPLLLIAGAGIVTSALIADPMLRIDAMNGVSYAVMLGYTLYFILSAVKIAKELKKMN